MADPIGLDPQTQQLLGGLLAYIQPQQSDMDQLKRDAIMRFGLGLLGGRKGTELATIGQSGMNALNQRNQELTQLQAQRGQNIQQGVGLLGQAQQLQRLQQSEGLGKGIGEIFSGGSSTPAGPQLQNMGPGGPTPANAAAVAPQPPQGAPSPADQVRAMAAKYRKVAEIYASAGPQYAAQFKQYADAANALEQQLEYSTTPQTVMDPKTNQPVNVLINKTGGTMPMQYQPKPDYTKVSNGQQENFVDLLTGKNSPVGTVQMQMTPGEKASNAVAWGNLAESKRKTNLQYDLDASGVPQGNTDEYARAIANYSVPFPQTIMYRRPEMGAQLMAKVQAENPSYDAKNYAAAQKTLSNFSSGKEAATVRAFNVGLAHLDTMGQAANALQNGDFPLVNSIVQAYNKQTGSAAPTNFDGVKQIVGNEIVKAIVGAGGGVGDREKAQETLSKAGSPEQLLGMIDQYKALMGGQLGGLRQSYEQGTGRKDFDRLLSPSALNVVSQQKAGAAATSQPVGTDKQTGQPLYRRADGKLYLSP
jgi:hypothetical protein